MKDEELDGTDIMDVIDAQLMSQGVSCIKVSDGHVYTFTTRLLEQLLEKSKSSNEQKVVVFVKTGVMS